MSAEERCILRGSRLVIPTVRREKVIEALHETNPGIVKIKTLARNYVWWLKMNEQLELKVKTIRCVNKLRRILKYHHGIG